MLCSPSRSKRTLDLVIGRVDNSLWVILSTDAPTPKNVTEAGHSCTHGGGGRSVRQRGMAGQTVSPAVWQLTQQQTFVAHDSLYWWLGLILNLGSELIQKTTQGALKDAGLAASEIDDVY